MIDVVIGELSLGHTETDRCWAALTVALEHGVCHRLAGLIREYVRAFSISLADQDDEIFAPEPRYLFCRQYRLADDVPDSADELPIETPTFDVLSGCARSRFEGFGIALDILVKDFSIVRLSFGKALVIIDLVLKPIGWKLIVVTRLSRQSLE